MGQAERDTRIAELLGGTALWERRHEKAGTWSRGMQQRLALARALLHRPSMLFLDEPTAGLDVMAAIQVRNDLSELPGREGMTIFLTTHNMAEAEQLCDLVAVVRGGRLLACGSPAQLRAGAGRPRIEVSGRGFDEATVSALRQRSEVVAVDRTDAGLTIELDRRVEPAPLVGLLVRHGAEVDEVRRVQVSLEEVFVALVEEDR
jgi:ABC-2 type transport system ATP-binding protein